MVQEGVMRRSDDAFSDEISRGMSAEVVAILFALSVGWKVVILVLCGDLVFVTLSKARPCRKDYCCGCLFGECWPCLF